MTLALTGLFHSFVQEKRQIVVDRASILHGDHETDVCVRLSFSIRRCQRSAKTCTITKAAIFAKKPTNRKMNIP